MLAVLLVLVGCATPYVVEEKQVGDLGLSCAQLKQQLAQADEYEAQAKNEKGVTRTNVVAAIVFTPAILITYKNADMAIDAANQRRRHLNEIMLKKGCGTLAVKSGDR